MNSNKTDALSGSLASHLQYPPVSGNTLREAHLYNISKTAAEENSIQMDDLTHSLAGSSDHYHTFGMIPSQRSSE